MIGPLKSWVCVINIDFFLSLSLSKMYSLYFVFPSGEIQPLALASFTFFSCFKCILFIHTYLSNLIKRPTLTYFFPLQRNVFKRKLYSLYFILWTKSLLWNYFPPHNSLFMFWLIEWQISYVHKVGRLDDFFWWISKF